MRGVFLRASPIDVSSLLEEKLFDKTDTVVMTSATLSSGGDFRFIIKSRLGAVNAETAVAPSSFDYPSQALIYLPPTIPEPRDPDYLSSAAREIVSILQASKGRAFVLSTSFYGMNSLFEMVSSRVGFPCFVQGIDVKIGTYFEFPKDAGCGFVRYGVILAGSRCSRRKSFVRDYRQIAVRCPDRPSDGGENQFH